MIVLDPFGDNYINYLGNQGEAYSTPARAAFRGLFGPLFDLLLAVAISLLLWRTRSPASLPFLLLGSYALFHESVAMIVGVIEGPPGDWSRVVSGIPPGVVILLALLMLAAACLWMLQLLPLVGIQYRDSFWRKLVVLQAGIPLLALCGVIYQALSSERVSQIFDLVASAVLVTIIVALHKPLYNRLKKISITPTAQLRWRDALTAIALAAAIVIVQLAFFNAPTAMMVMR